MKFEHNVFWKKKKKFSFNILSSSLSQRKGREIEVGGRSLGSSRSATDKVMVSFVIVTKWNKILKRPGTPGQYAEEDSMNLQFLETVIVCTKQQ